MAQRTVRAYPSDATCIVDGCDDRPQYHWMCEAHHRRSTRGVRLDAPLMRRGRVALSDRMAMHALDSASGCREWTGSRNAFGYGTIKTKGQSELVHRVAWEMRHGAVPDGIFVLHHCDNPPCFQTEPDERYPDGHLFLGTQTANVEDMDAKGRRRNAKGGAHGMARLTEADIPAIRSRVASGESTASVARSFGVGPVAVGRIVNGRSWKHVPIETER